MLLQADEKIFARIKKECKICISNVCISKYEQLHISLKTRVRVTCPA